MSLAMTRTSVRVAPAAPRPGRFRAALPTTAKTRATQRYLLTPMEIPLQSEWQAPSVEDAPRVDHERLPRDAVRPAELDDQPRHVVLVCWPLQRRPLRAPLAVLPRQVLAHPRPVHAPRPDAVPQYLRLHGHRHPPAPGLQSRLG